MFIKSNGLLKNLSKKCTQGFGYKNIAQLIILNQDSLKEVNTNMESKEHLWDIF